MTRVLDDIAEWQRERKLQRRAGLTLGFVPTMGALHEGHLSLVRRSRAENDRTLVSIFVNRPQFNDAADFEQYPRTYAVDVAMLEREGVEFVIMPTEEQLYPDGYRYRVSESDASRRLEGEFRPGHFDGVLTVVLKLLAVAAADRAYFGEKDWQQLTLVRGMVEAFFLPTAIVGCPTVREPDGLAMSSRNRRLTPADRLKAARLYQALSGGGATDDIARVLAAEGFVVDYVADLEDRRLAAVRLGDVRLIDNVPTRDGS